MRVGMSRVLFCSGFGILSFLITSFFFPFLMLLKSHSDFTLAVNEIESRLQTDESSRSELHHQSDVFSFFFSCIFCLLFFVAVFS